ncbi:hypothetical protein MY04_2118 [Flammeovirga sp. MY04]|uniref:hypothetical protein n=1 Tax=Flammeovirga sp. MY04 TaxID=1191459 RepID=UPI0008063BA4|nr:hypothetical protein [Flammeovirga sp. MY04]ANQ49492.1 hypothetical protein MY04_2118 [Flammeovirga sp. MY04]
MLKQFFITSLLLITSFNLLASGTENAPNEESPYNLMGEHDGKGMSVVWAVNEWPAGLEKMVIKKKSTSTGNEWTTLTKTPLSPGVKADKALDNVTDNAEFLAEMKQYQKEEFEKNAKGLASLSNEKLMKAVADNPKVIFWVNMNILAEYKFALMAGFGFKEINPKKEVVTYGLFPVINGKEATTPVLTKEFDLNAKTKNDPVIASKKAEKGMNDKGIKIDVTYEASSLPEHYGLYSVYRTESGTKEKVKASRNLKAIDTKLAEGEKNITLDFQDKEIDNTKKYTYEIVITSLFGINAKPITVEYTPAAQ